MSLDISLLKSKPMTPNPFHTLDQINLYHTNPQAQATISKLLGMVFKVTITTSHKTQYNHPLHQDTPTLLINTLQIHITINNHQKMSPLWITRQPFSHQQKFSHLLKIHQNNSHHMII
jgi:hypothetical protein